MGKKSSITAGLLNFFFPGIGLAYLAGKTFALFGVLTWISLVILQGLALAAAESQEMPGLGFWLVLMFLHNASGAALAAALAKVRTKTTSKN